MIKKSNQVDILSNNTYRYLLIIAGTLFLGFGIIGIIIPILPTTPFLLLAAACYARGSTRFYTWLMSNRWFGTYIKNYREGKGIPLLFKLITIALLWLTILGSIYFILSIIWIELVLLLIAAGVSIHIILIKTLKQKKD